MRIGLWTACFATSIITSSAAFAAEALSEAQIWKKTALTFELTIRFINNEKCKSSELYLRSCKAALAAAAEMAGSPESAESEDFEGTLRALEAKLPTDIPPQMMRARAINAHLAVFDPYAAIKPTEEFRSTATSGAKNYVGIGMAIEPTAQGIVIRETYPTSPASKAGLRDGDLITAIASDGRNFENALGFSADALADKVIGENGEPLAIRVMRDGREIEYAKIKRSSVRVTYVTSEVLDGPERAGYVRIRSFESLKVCREVSAQVKALQAKKIKRLILDLRGNRGGDKTMSICVAELFLGPKKVSGTKLIENSVPSIADVMHIEKEEFETQIEWEGGFVAKPTFTMPLVVLVDSMSASASEILAGALQDHNRAWIVGERTYGTGTAQTIETVHRVPSLSLKWTSERFFTPSGRSNQGVGISPNFAVSRQRGVDLEQTPRQRENDFLPNRMPAKESRVWIETRPEEVHDVLACVNNNVRTDVEDFQKAYGLAVLNCGT